MHIRPLAGLAISLLLLSWSRFVLTSPTLNHENRQLPKQQQQQPQQQTPLPIQSPNHKHDNFTLSPIRDVLVSNKIIGDVLDDFEPSYYLDVVYYDFGHVELGDEIPVADVQSRPQLTIYRIPDHDHHRRHLTDEKVWFTVALTDPDAKSRYDPKWSEMCHWIVTNVTFTTTAATTMITTSGGDDVETQTKNKKRCKADKQGGKCLPGELRSYFPPGPPKKTGWHRYVFVLLLAAGNDDPSKGLYGPEERKHWGYGKPRHGVRDWAAEYGLEVVGANFFFAENEKQ